MTCPRKYLSPQHLPQNLILPVMKLNKQVTQVAPTRMLQLSPAYQFIELTLMTMSWIFPLPPVSPP